MRKLLNTLYITNPDLYLGKDGSNIVIRNDKENVHQSPIQNYENIVCFNYTGMSPALMGLCAEHNVSVNFLTPSGRLRAKMLGPINGNVLLRREQYRIADDERALSYAKIFIMAKLYNSIQLLQRFLREHQNTEKAEDIRKCVQRMKESNKSLSMVEDADELLGIDGDASRNYFSVFDELILHNKDHFQFNARHRRPPTDPVNSMLSLTYSMIRILMENALETVGLDPYVGFFHKDRPGRTGFALDMMEELRSYMGDRFVLSLINQREINISDFYVQENAAVFFTETGMKKYLSLWQKRCQKTIKHPFLEETVEIGLIPYVQAMLMARTIRGDLELYPPFFMN